MSFYSIPILESKWTLFNTVVIERSELLSTTCQVNYVWRAVWTDLARENAPQLALTGEQRHDLRPDIAITVVSGGGEEGVPVGQELGRKQRKEEPTD